MDERIRSLLAFLPEFESKGYEVADWPKLPVREENGQKIYQMPYPIYRARFEDFLKAASAFAGDVHPYEALPEDTEPGGVAFSVLGAHFPPEFFAVATLDQLRRYFRLLHRGERFCDGYIEGQFKIGAINAALRRLAELSQDTPNG